MRKETLKKVVVLALTAALAMAPITLESKEAYAGTAGTVTLSVEKFTIGQGFVVEPVEVEITSESTVATVFEQVMKEQNIEYVNEGGTSFYLTSIKNADSGVVDIPDAIGQMEPYNQYWIAPDSYVYAPSNEANDGNESYPDLGAYSYNSMAGWMFTVNGASIPDVPSAVTVTDGDVVRCQFSVYGYGADLGIGWGTPANVEVADKEALIETIAKANKNKYLSDVVFSALYKKAIEEVASYDVTDGEIKLLAEMLTSAMTVVPTEPETEKETDKVTEPEKEKETTLDLKVGNAKIKKLKNLKGKKAKLVIKKVKGATGYQIKYSQYKSFKAKKVVTTKKLKYKLKKLNKYSTYFVKVRAYKVIDKNIYVYGKWSKAKKVTINK